MKFENMKKGVKVGLAGLVTALCIYGATPNANAATNYEKGTDYTYKENKYAPKKENNNLIYYAGGALVGLYLLCGLRTVRQTDRGLIERFGRYSRMSQPGLTLIIPGVEKLRKVNITEMMIDAQPQEIITKDKLNARVDAQVYFKVKSDEESLKASQYNVHNYKVQIVNLARTTLRNIIGTLTLNQANSERDKINSELMKTLAIETKNWGLEVVRTELKEIDPPKDVQDTMNKVVIAENEKIAAIDFATSAETKADGARRAEIKKAEGLKQAAILEAEGIAEAKKKVADAESYAIEKVNTATQTYFKGSAVDYKRLEVLATVLKDNTKYIIPEGTDLITVLGDEKDRIIPVPKSEKKE
ncbi:MAG: SPFH domain-containing protein [Nanoarchaeota archaeon]|nr:SPFH domain-containing protein [Nanoarchaeota archaeon]